MNQYRITKPDPHNWVIEQFCPGGHKVTRGKFTGNIAKDRWKVLGYYSNLKDAAIRLLDIAAGDKLISEEATSILAAIEAAKKEVLEAISNEKK